MKTISQTTKGQDHYTNSILTLMKRVEHGKAIKNQLETDNINMYVFIIKKMALIVVKYVIKILLILGSIGNHMVNIFNNFELKGI